VKWILNILGVLILLLLVAVSGALLFFEDEARISVNLLVENQEKAEKNNQETLKIAYLFGPENLNPFTENLNTKSRLYDVYEPLVTSDRNLVIKPNLAVSYGLEGDKSWEFVMRRGVRFHDGSDLKIEDVIYSLDKAKESKEFLNGIEKVEAVGENNLKITLKSPDPLFLAKLSRVFIVKKDFSDFAQPIGTGAYRVVDSSDLNKILYQKFDSYWGEKAYFEYLQIWAVSQKNARIDGLINKEFDFLVNVPPDAVEELVSRGLKLDFIPSLEVGMLMFNLKPGISVNALNVRRAIELGLNKPDFLDISQGYATVLSQFIGSGVFGYNPELISPERDLEIAKQEMRKTIGVFENLKVQFYFPENLNLLGQYLKDQLIQVGIDLDLKPVSETELAERLRRGELGFYYFGWRHDFGDSLPFLRAVMHSKAEGGYGELNGMNYKNEKVDELIKKSEQNLNVAERLADLQEAMKIVVKDDLVGIPLFETESIFAYQTNLVFQPRLDSAIYPTDVAKKMPVPTGFMTILNKIKTQLSI
jgi:peptide/nickel transport system substrate-binding protein